MRAAPRGLDWVPSGVAFSGVASSGVASSGVASSGVASSGVASSRLPSEAAFPRLPWQRLLGLVVLSSSVVSVEPAPFDVLMLLLGVALLLSRPRAFPALQRVALWLLVAWLLVNTGTLMASTDVAHALRYLLITAFMGVVFVVPLLYVNLVGVPERVATLIMRAWAVSAVLSAALGVLAYVGVPGLGFLLWYGRILGLFKDPNVFGPFLIPPLLYLLGTLLFSARFSVLRLASVLTLTLGVTLSFSRAAWINALVGGALLVALLLARRARVGGTVRARRLLPLLALLGAVGVAVLAQPATKSLLEERSHLQGYDNDRFGSQAAALESLMARPLGIGPGEVELTFSIATHSSYARTAAEYGVPGLVVLLVFLALSVLSAGRLAWGGSVTHMVALSSLVGLLVNSGVVDTLHWRHLWLVLSLCWFPVTGSEQAVEARAAEAPSLRVGA